jgi:lipopolysaccharide/colanic/teichoic acid biosynthesis glycosyltransferase
MGKKQEIMNIVSSVLALLLMLFLSPVLVLIGTLLAVCDGFPILFKQQRVGFGYQPFSLYKFRTMKSDINQDRIEEIHDARITKFGSTLRKTKLDELPQLYNILKGEMGFVGPRPELKKYIDQFNAPFLSLVKPGLTDYASIILRNENQILARAGGPSNYNELLKLKLQLGQIYAGDKNIILDVKLIIITIISLKYPRIAQSLVLRLLNFSKYDCLENEIHSWISE